MRQNLIALVELVIGSCIADYGIEAPKTVPAIISLAARGLKASIAAAEA